MVPKRRSGSRGAISVLVVVFVLQIVLGLVAGSAVWSPDRSSTQPVSVSVVQLPVLQDSASVELAARVGPSRRSIQSTDSGKPTTSPVSRAVVSLLETSPEDPTSLEPVAEEVLLASIHRVEAATGATESSETTAEAQSHVDVDIQSDASTQLTPLAVELFVDDVEVSAERQPYVPEPEVLAVAFAAPPVRVFPVVGGGRYSSSFGTPRSEGRTHQGNDIFAEKMTPVLAVASGTVVVATRGPGEKCCFVRIRHEDGSETLYVHLNNDTEGTDDGLGYGIAEGIAKGTRVEAGEVIGYVGDSGNAEATSSHLHFEYHPAGAEAIDPHQLLRGAPILVDLNAPLPIVAASHEELPFTGPASTWLAYVAVALLVAGVAALIFSRRLESGQLTEVSRGWLGARSPVNPRPSRPDRQIRYHHAPD